MMYRRDSFMPYQDWNAFPGDAIVLVRNAYDDFRIGLARNFWWGYEEDMGGIAEGVIVMAKRLDRPKGASHACI